MLGSPNVPVLSVLEGKWRERSHLTMRDLFYPLFTLWTQNPDTSLYYEQFTTGSAFKAALSHAFQPHQASTIYIV